MATVAQLVEPSVVVRVVASSSLVGRPIHNFKGKICMTAINFTGDPMVQFESLLKSGELEGKVVLLNQESADAINSYCDKISNTKVPEFIAKNIKIDNPNITCLFAEGGIDETGNVFPDTYICLEQVQGGNIKLSAVYADDMQYAAPQSGEEILFEKINERDSKDSQNDNKSSFAPII